MAKRDKAKKRAPTGQRVRRWLWRGALGLVAFALAAVGLYVVVNPPTTPYMISESRRLGGVDHEWTSLDEIAPEMARSVVAAEDARFCQHWGFDVAAIRAAIDAGGARGASTISQQVVKNVYLWQGRSWPRKALEASLTPLVEAFWSKRRIVEVYLNVAEFGEGVFGIDAAAREAFGVSPSELTPTQAARLAAVLPNPKERSAADPTDALRRRAAQIMDGAATIARDGRADCFDRAAG
ncbi:monofunctional biosynthetic peptidoglycan transglycosylase [Palleronia marisminoris]|uniref:Biosynthetic peptidoglycan transglycosylase n=1 Tax=Palleronia marisminoris TaxID=315423 RepID=A0A1Y5STP7_9RHOB|nr:monofunctional biosynthetic peptidoglycan transglycosylase [Palleronia marisminoris]SFG97111.1 monofunctional biosynthetic peptidoglycan transglycosylase [Palleronia marisminoris]SLN47626.1 Penicillin-binding protein 2D [Palleronia marisminoris]